MVASIPLNTENPIVLDGVSWETYEEVLREIGDRPIRVTFWRGRMEIISPLPEHEDEKRAIARLLDALADELDLPLHGFGSATFRREGDEAGLEPDECYYLQNEDRVLGMKRFDPAVHPAPDLAIEIDLSRRSIEREPIYATLGVRELWRFNGREMTVRLLQADKTYQTAASSLSFPFLPLDRIVEFVNRMILERQTPLVKEFRRWVRTLPKE